MKNFFLGFLIIPSIFGLLFIAHTLVLKKTDGLGGEITNRIIRLELVWLAMNKPHLFSDVMPDIFLDVTEGTNFPPNVIISPAILNSSAFDLSYFIKKNPKIARDLDNDKDRIGYYWLTHLDDCLDSSPNFNPIYYLNNNNDVKKLSGNSCAKAVRHWVQYGISEGRNGAK